MTIIIGIDPSLTGTGIARIDTDDQLVVDTWTIATKGVKDASLPDRWERLDDIKGQVWNAVHGYGPDGNRHPRQAKANLVVIEQPAFSRTQGSQHDRSGLWWLILNDLIETIDVAEVTPTARAKYATGKGNAGKDTVLLEVARRFPHVDVRDNNQADSLILAAMGADHAGVPLVELPKVHREALAKVAWPSNVPAPRPRVEVAHGSPGPGRGLMESGFHVPEAPGDTDRGESAAERQGA